MSFGITALLGVAAFLLALNPPDLIVWINLFAFGGLEAALSLAHSAGALLEAGQRLRSSSGNDRRGGSLFLVLPYLFQPPGDAPDRARCSSSAFWAL